MVEPLRPEFREGPPRFYGSMEVRGWLRTLGLIYDAKGIYADERFRYTLPLLDGPALKMNEYANPATFVDLSNQLISSFCDKHDRFHKFQKLVALHQRGSDVDGYIDKFMAIFAQVPNMSAQDSISASVAVPLSLPLSCPI